MRQAGIAKLQLRYLLPFFGCSTQLNINGFNILCHFIGRSRDGYNVPYVTRAEEA